MRMGLYLSLTLFDMEVTCLTTIRAKMKYKTAQATKNIFEVSKKYGK
jgi:hypothetical protein